MNNTFGQSRIKSKEIFRFKLLPLLYDIKQEEIVVSTENIKIKIPLFININVYIHKRLKFFFRE